MRTNRENMFHWITRTQSCRRFLLVLVVLCYVSEVGAQNPSILDQFTADPSARVFNGRVYVYPSHDIPCTEGKGRIGWFCMEDYHVFSSDNLIDWTDHGVIVKQNDVPWARRDNYSMWAPDCIAKGGKYYFYFPTLPKDTTHIKGFTIGAAVADRPEGPYVLQKDPIAQVRGIDPNVFIDKDGQAYLYWSQGHIYGAKLKDNMLELDSPPVIFANLPEKGLKEGPYMIERNGIYYLTYPHVEKGTERLEYAVGNNPLGPFTVKGVIMDESPTGCWTNHHSMINFGGQWYLFYHHNDLSPAFDKNRSIRVDSLTFEADGAIRKVKPTLRGVGVIPATRQIQLDRCSDISSKNASISFLDSAKVFDGWKTTLTGPEGWVRFNRVGFTGKKFRTVSLRVRSEKGGSVDVYLDKSGSPAVAKLKVSASPQWTIVSSRVENIGAGVHDIFVLAKSGSVDIDWIRFE